MFQPISPAQILIFSCPIQCQVIFHCLDQLNTLGPDYNEQYELFNIVVSEWVIVRISWSDITMAHMGCCCKIIFFIPPKLECPTTTHQSGTNRNQRQYTFQVYPLWFSAPRVPPLVPNSPTSQALHHLLLSLVLLYIPCLLPPSLTPTLPLCSPLVLPVPLHSILEPLCQILQPIVDRLMSWCPFALLHPLCAIASCIH